MLQFPLAQPTMVYPNSGGGNCCAEGVVSISGELPFVGGGDEILQEVREFKAWTPHQTMIY